MFMLCGRGNENKNSELTVRERRPSRKHPLITPNTSKRTPLPFCTNSENAVNAGIHLTGMWETAHIFHDKKCEADPPWFFIGVSHN